MIRTFRLLAIAVLLIASVACKTLSPTDWDARVGTFTFDDAVKELGPPDKSATLTDGTRVAEWMVIRGWNAPTFHTFPDGRIIRTDGSRGPDRWLRLTFPPDGKLSEWRRLWR